MMKKYIMMVALCCAALSTQAQSVQIYRAGAAVGAAHSTLAAAIVAAANGDSLRMSAHTFYEHDVFINKNLVIAGSHTSIDSTTIDAQSLGRVLRTKSRNITLRDLIITHGKTTLGSDGGGIRMDTFGVLTLTGNTIVRNNVAGQFGGGIAAVGITTTVDSVVLRLKDYTKVQQNNAKGGGGIALGSNPSKIYLSNNCLIDNNSATALYYTVGGIGAKTIVVEGTGTEGGVRVMNNSSKYAAGGLSTDTLILNGTISISNNHADSLGGGISLLTYILGKGKMDIYNNTAYYGGGVGNIFYFGGTEASILIHNNRAKYGGGLASVEYGGLGLHRHNQNMNIYDNIADSVGGGAYYVTTSISGAAYYSGLYHANIYNNTANKHNGVYAENRLNLIMNQCRVFNPNVSSAQSPEVYMKNNVYFQSDSCWYGKSDTTGLIVKDASSVIEMPRWVVCDWVLNNGFPIATWAPNFPLAARFRLSTGVPLPSNSFAMLQGRFSGTLGSFTPALANMKPINEIESRFAVSSVGMASLMGIVDADTFRHNLSVSVGIAEKGFEHLRIYPNPASDYLHIDGAEIGSSIELYDISGKIVRHEKVMVNNTLLDIKVLPAGTYILKIITKNGEVGIAKVRKE